MSVAGFDCGDGFSIAGWVDLGHGGLGEVAAVGDLPFVVDVGQDRADEADDGGLVREDADDAGSAFDLLVDPLQGVGRPDLRPVRPGEGGEGQHFGFRVVHQRPDLGEAGGELVADGVPGGRGGFRIRLGEDRAEHRSDHVLVRLRHQRQELRAKCTRQR